ncbi:sigma factor-like helix-turn-helix DNA-binding protein [Sphingomonas sp. ac-8]|uniref:sigma factor-like helix-turn-helix DNA-binding protein n=1 Tax=Sphingomonas sp. ac-8 TaxID=3242977 RepID=UPI003A7FB5E9
MSSNPVEQLTEAQRECLRLVFTRHNSKEIAALVGVSPSAVDKRIERAVQQLGVPTRFAAARLLAEHEGREVAGGQPPAADNAIETGALPSASDEAAYERLPSDPIDVPDGPTRQQETPRDEPLWLVRRLFGVSPDAGFRGQTRNPLGKLGRLGVIAGLVVTIAFASMALLNMGQTLSKLLKDHRAASSR